MPTARTPTTHLRRVLANARQPLTRAQLYERQRRIDDIAQMDTHLARMVAAGEIHQIDGAYTLKEAA